MKVLKINSSSDRSTSKSRKYVDKLVGRLQEQSPNLLIAERDVTYSDLPFVNDKMLSALFVKGEHTKEQREILRLSNMLIDELIDTDTLVIGAPIYNFSVPASLKAYFDLVARAGRTFKYTENGAVGLLEGKKPYIVITSGGTEVGSDVDFASNYITHFLGFIGITDVEIIPVD